MPVKLPIESKEGDRTMADDTGGDGHDPSRRDFLYVAAGGMGAVGVAGAVWPMIDQMNPSQDVLALSSIEVDLSGIEEGQSRPYAGGINSGANKLVAARSARENCSPTR